VRIRGKIIALSAAFAFWAGWSAAPATCSAQGYCYPAPPVQVYNYSLLPQPNYYSYAVPVAEPVGYSVAYPAAYPYKCKYKHKHKHKRKHGHKHSCY
jgi:hypothetical protein